MECHKCFDHCSFGVFLDNQTHQQINEKDEETTKLMKRQKSRDMVYFSNVVACFSPKRKRLKLDPPENDCYALACFLEIFLHVVHQSKIPSFFCMQKNLWGKFQSLKNGWLGDDLFPVWMRPMFHFGEGILFGHSFF